MNETIDQFVQSMRENQAGSTEVMAKVLVAAQPGAVFGEPISVENQTVITASEVFAGGALGNGGGAGGGASLSDESTAPELPAKEGTGVGGGSGVLGCSKGRPVAAIIVNTEGVRVEPIVDVTKIGLALLTTLGAILITLFKIRRDALGNQ